ncbi:MAG: hypothetical protein GY809_27305, partial [Planctomycetes bacterium]|nr:hypothetical protein [Planctomycetota bacterium]
MTTLTSGTGDDVVNIETIAGRTTVETGEGSDIVRVGSTTAHVGQILGIIEAFSSSLNAIDARLIIVDEDGSHDYLKVYDSGDDTAENGELRSDEIVGLGMTLGIEYQGFELLTLWLSDNDNGLYIDSTHAGVTQIDTGDEDPVINGTNDIININSTSGTTTIDMGRGNDVVRVNYDNNGDQTSVSGIDGELTLHGQQGSDKYDIGLAGGISSRINVFDESRGDTGIDYLRVYGTNQTDFFLIRANKDVGQGMVAAIEVDENREPVQGGVIERINYDGNINGAIEIYGRDGDDT